MSDEEMPVAGWYPAAHAGGEQRFWDGAQWREDVSRPAQYPGEEVGATPFMQRPMKRKVGVIVASSALAIGLMAGAGVGGVSSQTQVADLESELRAVQAQLVSVEESARDFESEASAAREDLAAATEDLAVMERELSTTAEDLESALVRADELEVASAGQVAELEARAARIAELESAASAPIASTPQQSVSVSYANCSAVRAAGAAPIRQGEPGYGSHLDRDGDGVGCE